MPHDNSPFQIYSQNNQKTDKFKTYEQGMLEFRLANNKTRIKTHNIRKSLSSTPLSSPLSSSTSSSSSSSASTETSSKVDNIYTPLLPNCKSSHQLTLNPYELDENQSGQEQELVLYNLQPAVTNSALVRLRASAKDILAAASVTTGASLPLMIGGRSTCVVNLVESSASHEESTSRSPNPSSAASSILSANGPQNTALRAEQRNKRQNAVSIVRPVVNHSPVSPQESIQPKLNRRLEETALWAEQASASKQKVSLIEELMSLESQLNTFPTSSSFCAGTNMLDMSDHFLQLDKAQPSNNQQFSHQHPSEQQLRQQMALYRREQHELNRNVKRQHRFIVSKIEERKRYLQIIQSVWIHKDFKHAIEKLVDIYNQGLVFTSKNELKSTSSITKAPYKQAMSQLNSLNSSVVVDVVAVLVLRPKLWNLETCQLLLPIIINDLLLQDASPYEHYIEVAIKSIRLVLTNFSPVIRSTLESQKEATKLSIGVDISREDRVNRCISCHRLLMEAKSLIARRLASRVAKSSTTCAVDKIINDKLSQLSRELEQHLSI